MAYIGNIPAEKFTSVDIQNFSVSATANYTLDRPVANENEIELFINNVRQHPGSGKAYTASGTALTLSEATAGTDTMYCVYQGKARQTVTPATSSVTNAMLAGSIDLTSKVTGALPQANIADQAINEAKMQISNAPTNGYMLTAQSGNTGGLTWAEAPSGGFTRLAGSNVTGQNLGDISFDNVFSSTYNLYYVIWRVNFTTNSSQLWLRMRDGSGFKTNSNYKFILTGENWSETESSISSSGGDDKFRLTGGLNSADDDTGAYGYLYFYRPFNSGKVTEVTMGVTEKDESYVITTRVGAGSFQNTASCTGFGFLGSNQNLEDCDITVYGVNQS